MRQLYSECTCGSGKTGSNCCFKYELELTEDYQRQILPALTKLQQLSNHLALLIPRKSKNDDLKKFARDNAFKEMAFGKDKETINALLKSSGGELSGKIRVLKSLLPTWKEEKSKVLLFSYSTHTLESPPLSFPPLSHFYSILSQFLRKHRFTFLRMDGKTPSGDRQSLVNSFNRNPNIFIFLASTKASGLGLNLTAANIVVVFDTSWNPTNDLQAQDRAYRIGQQKYTRVYRFVSAGTIEEMKYSRQIYKQQLANLSTGKNERRYFRGVAGVKGQEGEIFGIKNLFKFNKVGHLFYITFLHLILPGFASFHQRNH